MPRAVPVSQATLADAKLLAGLYAASFGRAHEPPSENPSENPWSEKAMAQFIAGPGTLCLIGTIGDAAPAGFLIARRAADEAELLTLGVLPEHRRQGVAWTLLQHARATLHRGGANRLFLEVAENNFAAVALYRALSAEPVGHRKRYYENGADAAIFSLDLQP